VHRYADGQARDADVIEALSALTALSEVTALALECNRIAGELLAGVLVPALAQLTTLRRLDCCRGISDGSKGAAVSAAITPLSQLTHLRLAGFQIATEHYELAAILAQQPRLASLELLGLWLWQPGVQRSSRKHGEFWAEYIAVNQALLQGALARLQHCAHVTRLRLAACRQRNALQDVGLPRGARRDGPAVVLEPVVSIQALVTGFTQLRRLCLLVDSSSEPASSDGGSMAQMRTEDMKALAALPALEYVDLSGHCISPKGAAAAAPAFQQMRHLRTLRLARCGGNHGVPAFIQALAGQPAGLQQLDLQGYEYRPSLAGAAALRGCGLIVFSQVKVLNMHDLDVSFECAQGLADAMRAMPGLQALQVGCADVYCSQGSPLLEVLRGLSGSLRLRSLSLGLFGSSLLDNPCAAFERCAPLTQLVFLGVHMRGCRTSTAGVAIATGAAKAFPALRKVEVDMSC
jgi:Leucine Rich repeat